MIGSATPRGLGIYLSRTVRSWDVQEAMRHAKRAQRARIKHVALCAEALDGWRADPKVLADCAAVYRDIGCSLWAYSLPGKSLELPPERDGVVANLLRAVEVIQGRGSLLDAEEKYRGKGERLRRHRQELTDGSTERTSIGVTAYGSLEDDGFPWEEIRGWCWLGLQLYLTAVNRARVRRRLEAFRAANAWGDDVVPHLATYGRLPSISSTDEGSDGPRRLLGDLTRTCLNDEGECDVPGVWFWQDSTLDGFEADVLADWAARVGW